MSNIVQQKWFYVSSFQFLTSHLPSLLGGDRVGSRGEMQRRGNASSQSICFLTFDSSCQLKAPLFCKTFFCPKFASQSPVAKICTDGMVSSRLFGLCQISKSLSMMLRRQESVYPKVSSEKSSTRERERGNLLWVGIGQEIEMYRPPSMGMSELT